MCDRFLLPTCYRKLKHLPGDFWKHVLQLLDEAEFFRSCTKHLADLVHQLHRPGHVIAILLTHLRMKPCKRTVSRSVRCCQGLGMRTTLPTVASQIEWVYFDGHTMLPVKYKNRLGSYHYVKEGIGADAPKTGCSGTEQARRYSERRGSQI